MMERDYCSFFPERWRGNDIQPCCKNHDNEVGMRGTYSPVTPHTGFFKCLKSKGTNLFWRSVITLGGALMSWIKYPWLAFKIYKYRKGK